MARTGREAGYCWARIDLDVAPKEAIGAQFRGRMSLSPSVYLLLDKPLFT